MIITYDISIGEGKMQKLVLILALFVIADLVAAQQTRTEKTNVTTTADDTKPNDDSVPMLKN